MGKEKPLEQEAMDKPTYSSDAADWLNTFKKHFLIAFQDAASSFADGAGEEDLQRTAVSAMISTLRDSGLSHDQMLLFLGEAFEKPNTVPVEWTSVLNQRRIDLIDRGIEKSISLDEKFELARLTAALRASVSTEELFPMEGARDLHAKLKAMKQKEDQN